MTEADAFGFHHPVHHRTALLAGAQAVPEVFLWADDEAWGFVVVEGAVADQVLAVAFEGDALAITKRSRATVCFKCSSSSWEMRGMIVFFQKNARIKQLTQHTHKYTFGVKLVLNKKLLRGRSPGGFVLNKITNLHEERALMGFRDAFIRLRKKKDWTQQEVADQIGISVGQVKKYEKGSSAPNLHVLRQIATVFGVSADEFVFGDGNGPATTKLDAELLGRFEKVAKLPDRERDAILVLIDSVVAKQTLKEVIGS